MREQRVEVELTDEELEVLLLWAERATRGLYPGCDRYLGETEARLLSKLEKLKSRGAADEREE